MKKYIVYIAILSLFCIGFFALNVSDKKDKKEIKDYPILKKMFSQPISGKVIFAKKTMNHYSKGRFLIKLDTNRFSLNGNTSNKQYNPSDIELFLQLNDSIYKPAYSDSIYIYRDGKTYYFISGINL